MAQRIFGSIRQPLQAADVLCERSHHEMIHHSHFIKLT